MSWVGLPVRLLGFLVIAVGAWASLRWVRPADVFAGLYVLALLPWSFGSPRYLLPVLPFAYAYLLIGGEEVWSWAARRSRAVRLGAALTLTLCGLMVGSSTVRGAWAMARRALQGPSVAFNIGAPLVRDHTPPDALILTEWDSRSLVFETGRRGSQVPHDTTDWAGYAAGVGATHLLIRGDRDGVVPWARRDGWRFVARDAAADLYAIPPPDSVTAP